MTLAADFALNLAAGLTETLFTAGSAALTNLALGDAETRRLRAAWQAALQTTIEQVTANLDKDQANHVDSLLREFVQAEDVAADLLALALAGEPPPLPRLQRRFSELGFDPTTLPVGFEAMLSTLTGALAQTLLAEAAPADSPLVNRVSLMRLAAIHTMLYRQGRQVETIAQKVAELEASLPADSRYNLIFLGPVSGIAVGDNAAATLNLDHGLRPLLEQTLARLTELAAPRQPVPYSPADKAEYLREVVAASDTIQLPYAPDEGQVTLPLEAVYVALKADHSSPVERRASRRLLERQARQQAAGRLLDEIALLQAARMDPYGGLHRIYDPQLMDQLRAEANRSRTYHLAEAIRSQQWLVLLGDPGSGKSTLARWLALQLARSLQQEQAQVTVPARHVQPDAGEGAVETLGPARLPVLIRLADYVAARWPGQPSQAGQDTGLSLRNYLGRHLEARLAPGQDAAPLHALLTDYLAAGRVTFILDGLDEVTNLTQRQTIVAAIETLIRDWGGDDAGRCPLDPVYHPALRPDFNHGNQIIVTSRIVGYYLQPLHDNLPHFVIQPMDDTAVTRFCHNWAEATGHPAWAEALTEAVLKHPNPNVREQMARNPLLLTILAQVFQASPQIEVGLPHRRTELYHRAAETVFSQRQQAQWGVLFHAARPDHLKAALYRLTAALADRLHANPDFAAALVDHTTVKGWLLEWLPAEPALTGPHRSADLADDFLRAAANYSGFFVARGQGVYGFLHRQFQEYFAARHLAAQAPADPAAGWPLFTERLGNPNWREVLLLAVGRLAESRPAAAAGLLHHLLAAPDPGGRLPHALLFVAGAMRELAETPPDLVQAVAAGLIQAYRRDDAYLFEVLHERLEQAFAALPRPQRRRDPVGEALAAALLAPAQVDDEAARYTRLAALDLLLENEWYTPATIPALSRAWSRHLEPTGTTLLALERAYAARSDLFNSRALRRSLPVRRALQREPALWATIEQHPHWQAVLTALYLAPDADLTAGALVRDSTLTDDLLALLRDAPADRAALVELLLAHFDDPDPNPLVWRDAGLALAYLGVTEAVPRLIPASRRQQPAARALLARLALDLDLHLASGLDLARAHALASGLANEVDLARDLALDLARDLDVDLDLARDLDVDLDLAGTLASDLVLLYRASESSSTSDLNLNLSLDRARASDLTRDLASDRYLTRARNLICDLTSDRDRAREIIHILDSRLQAFLPDTLHQILVEARRKAADLAALLTAPEGVLTFWQALGQQWTPVQPATPADALPAPRPRLTSELLAHLQATWPQPPPGFAWDHLLPRLQADKETLADPAAQECLHSWLSGPDPLPARHAALLLAESGHLSRETLPPLLACLADPVDLTRYRAQQALNQERSAGAVGRDALQWMANQHRTTGHTLTDTTLDWSLKEIEHDQPDWLRDWATAETGGILDRVHRLSTASCPVWLELLAEAAPAVQAEMLESTGWLLRHSDNTGLFSFPRLKPEQIEDLLPLLQTLAAAEDKAVSRAALAAVGHVPRPAEGLVEMVLGWFLTPAQRDNRKEVRGRATLTESLARLAARLDDEHDALRQRVEAALAERLTEPDIAAAWVRLCVSRASRETDLSALLKALATGLQPAELLIALLRAGTDTDGWGAYHERLAQLVSLLAQGSQDSLLADLLDALQDALDTGDWPPVRIAVAAVPACAEAMPDALNQAWPDPTELEALLLEAAENAGSHNVRRYAITALSRLRQASPDVLTALLEASRGVHTVQQDAVEAAGNFRHLSPAFSHEESLAPLVEALRGPSQAAAYLAAKLLGALGSSPANIQIPALRQRIAALLSEALDSPQAEEEVYLLKFDDIRSEGPLAHTLLAELVRVTGLPE